MASLTLKNLNKRFGTVHAVDDVNLDIRDGEFVSLLGPSGCGKTTTLRMIAGLETSDGGSIHIDGKDVTQASARERNIAMVFQDYALYPHMTVLENVGYPLKVRGIGQKEIEQRVGEVAGRLQIGMLLERRPSQLSGGQQQRVALARAVVHRATVTLYDEPLSNLDTKLRMEARAFLKHLQREVGLTSVYVTHDQAEAMALSDRIVVMNAGQVMQVGAPMDIYRKPVTTFVASFIGSPPMNLLPVHIDDGAGVVSIADKVTIPLNKLANRDRIVQGKPVTLGTRPEHMALHETKPDTADKALIPAELYVVQELGSETLAIVYVGDQLIAARLRDDQTTDLPKQVWLELMPDRVFFYDEQGKLIV